MIAHLSGQVVYVGAQRAVIDVAGVGYEFLATPTTLADLREGQTQTVHTYLAVREDALTLYGFSSADERHTFAVLLGVSGIGPKLALATLSALTPAQLRQALADGDEAALCRISGVGRKSAKRMLLDIGDKLGPVGASGQAGSLGPDPLVGALENLGWPRADAEAAVAECRQQHVGADDATVVRAALVLLGRNRG